MKTEHIIICIALLFARGSLGKKITSRDIKISPTAEPGLYFHEQRDIYFIKETWNVDIFLDLNAYKNVTVRLFRELIKIQNQCPNGVYDCETFNLHFRELKQKGFDLEKRVDRAIASYTDIPVKTREQILLARGWDIEEISGSSIANSTLRTLRIGSIVNTFNETLAAYIENQVSLMEAIIKEPQNKYSEVFASLWFSALIEFDQELDHILFHPVWKFLNNLNSIKINDIFDVIVSKEELIKVINTIEKQALMSESSINFSSLYLSTFSVNRLENQLIIEVKIPMFVKNIVKLYEIKSLPSAQNFLPSSIAYILPASRYLLVNNKSYAHFEDSDLKNCRFEEKQIVCPRAWFSFRTEENCEFSLFLNKNQTDFRMCRIKYIQTKQPIFTKIFELDSLVVTSNKAFEVKVKCFSQEEFIVYIKNSGLLQFPPECTINYLENHFSMERGQKNFTHIIIPNISLEISKILQVSNYQEFFNSKKVEELWELERYVIARQQKLNVEVEFIIIFSILGICFLLISFIIGILIYVYIYMRYYAEEDEISLHNIEAPPIPQNPKPEKKVITRNASMVTKWRMDCKFKDETENKEIIYDVPKRNLEIKQSV